MYITELLDLLKLEGVPHKKAMRQARAMLKEQERQRRINSARLYAQRKEAKRPPYGGWGNGR
jgi:hypothetical protein